MCFSAQASFMAAGVLSCIGLLTLKEVKKPSEYMLAGVPFLFAIQQAAEGGVWVTHASGNSSLQNIYVYLFLTFAFLIWPVWCPFSLRIWEPKKQRQQWLNLFCVLGIAVTLYNLSMLLAHTVTIDVFNCSIWYRFTGAAVIPHWLSLSAYVIAVAVPFFVTSLPYGALFGVLLIISLMLSLAVTYVTFISVWCFFAALLSALIYMNFKK